MSSQQQLISMNIANLKCLHNLQISFDGNNVTGIFGVNELNKKEWVDNI